MKMNDLQSRIERYLLNEMTSEDAQGFLKQIENDPKLEEEVEMVALIIGATRQVGQKNDMTDIELMRQASLSEIEELTGRKGTTAADNTEKTPILSIRTAIWALSGIAAIFLAILFVNHNKQSNNLNQLYADFYKPLAEEVGASRGSNDISETDNLLLIDGLNLYSHGKYAEALTKFNQISEASQRSVSVFSAISLLETDKAKQAVQQLETAISDYGEGWEYYQDAQWYLALAYLKNKQEEGAEKILKFIVTSDRYYAKQASELLKQL